MAVSTLDLAVAWLTCTRIYWWEIIDGKLLVTKAFDLCVSLLLEPT